MYSHPKDEALRFEDTPVALHYARGGARRFWERVRVGAHLTGPKGVIRRRPAEPPPFKANVTFEEAAARLDELLAREASGPLTDAERAEMEKLLSHLVRWERVGS